MADGGHEGWYTGVPGRPEREAAKEERMTAAVAYLLWPLAIPTAVDSGDAPRSEWLKFHARQSIVLGIGSWFFAFCVFSVPFFLILSGAIPFTYALTVYEAAFFVDAMVVGLLIALAIQCARRASHGERFTLRDLLPQNTRARKE